MSKLCFAGPPVHQPRGGHFGAPNAPETKKKKQHKRYIPTNKQPAAEASYALNTGALLEVPKGDAESGA